MLRRLEETYVVLFLVVTFSTGVGDLTSSIVLAKSPWPRHTIDDTARGADGVRFADVNGDDWPDAVVGWEESGIVRVYLHPGPGRVKVPWPAVTIGKTTSVEDAVLVDLDEDGNCDVVSCCEGRERSVFIHWAPPKARILSSAAWRVEPVPSLQSKQQFMFCRPAQIDGNGGIDLVIGGKGPGAELGWLQSPSSPRDLGLWRWYLLRPVGWVMSLIATDMDGDGDVDIVFSDRKGSRRGCYWLECPDDPVRETWTEHVIGCHDVEPMFLTLGDLDGTGTTCVVCATAQDGIHVMRPKAEKCLTWAVEKIPMPDQSGTGKAVAICDVNQDGHQDLVVSCEHATGKSGVFWISKSGQGQWAFHDVSGPEGIKFDLVQPLDLDGDGDLDLVTTEEQAGLGVIWYENPLR
ncbi:MAG: FG-GAP repeat domain-containing protein [Thermogutta sp.]